MEQDPLLLRPILAEISTALTANEQDRLRMAVTGQKRERLKTKGTRKGRRPNLKDATVLFDLTRHT